MRQCLPAEYHGNGIDSAMAGAVGHFSRRLMAVGLTDVGYADVIADNMTAIYTTHHYRFYTCEMNALQNSHIWR